MLLNVNKEINILAYFALRKRDPSAREYPLVNINVKCSLYKLHIAITIFDIFWSVFRYSKFVY